MARLLACVGVVLACCGGRAVNGSSFGAQAVGGGGGSSGGGSSGGGSSSSGGGGGIGTAQFGTRQTSFSGSAYDTVTNAGPDLCASGSSFVLAFDNPSGTTAAHAIPLGHYDGSTGCYADVQAGVVKIVQNPGGVTASLGLTMAAGPGPHVLAVAVTGGNFRAFLDGVGGTSAPAVVATSGSYVAPDSSAVMVLGAGQSGASPWTGGVLQLKAYARALSDAELYVLSGNRQDNRYAIMVPSGGEGSLVLDAKPGRDWNGAASTWTSLGSSPVTFTVVGAPALANVSECWAPRSALLAGMLDTLVSPKMPSAWGRTVLTTTDAVVYADYASGNNTVILAATYVDGAYAQSQCGPDTCNPSVQTYANAGQVFPIAVGAGTHTTEIDDGEAILTGSPPSAPGPAESQPLLGVRTSACPVVQVSTAPANGHVVALGDSICVGAVSNQLGIKGWSTLLRDAYRSKGVGVSMFCQSGNSLYENAHLFYGASPPASLQAMAADLVALVQKVQTGGPKWIINALGENDLSFSYPAFGTDYQNLLLDIHALDSTIQVLASTPAYSCTNESAAVMLRGVINTAVLNANSTAGVTFAHFLDNTSTVSPGNVTACPHYNNAGHQQMETAVAGALPF